MPVAADRVEFMPPPQPGALRGFALALLAHLLLLVALTWGLQWKRDSQDMAAEAELWSSIPQQAAPKEVQVPPPPPGGREQPKPEPQPNRDAEIALEREKKAQAQRRHEEELKKKQQQE